MNFNYRIFLIFIWSVLFSTILLGQKQHEVNTPLKNFTVENCYFKIEEVIDFREDKSTIGRVRVGSLNSYADAIMSPSLEQNLDSVLTDLLKSEDDFIPLTMHVKEFYLKEVSSLTFEESIFELRVEFFLEGESVYVYREFHSKKSDNAIEVHGINVYKGLEDCLNQLSEILYSKGLCKDLPYKYRHERIEESKKQAKDVEDEYLVENDADKVDIYTDPKERNVFAIGYQVGGWSLVGVDYEHRASDVFGFHVGVGIVGYTVGIKLHTNLEKKSPFFNLNYKDLGFGLLRTAGVEYGGNVIKLSKYSDFGLFAQLGYQHIFHVDDRIKEDLFGIREVPDGVISIGLGFSW